MLNYLFYCDVEFYIVLSRKNACRACIRVRVKNHCDIAIFFS